MRFCIVLVGLLVAGCETSGTDPADAGPRDSGASPGDAAARLDAGSGNDAAAMDGSPGDAGPGWTPTRAPCGDPGGFGECAVPGWAERPYQAYLPTTLDVSAPTAVLFVLHGGSGNPDAAINATCPDADRSNPSCMHQVAEREGFVAIFPSGTFTMPGVRPSRAWNSGGGGPRADGGSWQCVGGPVCGTGIDEADYFTQVLDDLDAWLNVDRDAVFATGLSNGGAMTHRLACELADRFAAIATIGGGNQLSVNDACDPSEPVAVLQVHGTGDLCWRYDESDQTCVISTPVGFKIGAEESNAWWLAQNGCETTPSMNVEADEDGDGLFTTTFDYPGCDADVALYRIEGHGHTYPNGSQYLPAEDIGPTATEWGSERLWAWLFAHRR